MQSKGYLGEFLGTFILTLFGCACVAVAVLFGEYNSIFQVGIVWGLGVTLAIFLTRNICCAHLNPAISIAMVVAGRMKIGKLPGYLISHIARQQICALYGHNPSSLHDINIITAFSTTYIPARSSSTFHNPPQPFTNSRLTPPLKAEQNP